MPMMMHCRRRYGHRNIRGHTHFSTLPLGKFTLYRLGRACRGRLSTPQGRDSQRSTQTRIQVIEAVSNIPQTAKRKIGDVVPASWGATQHNGGQVSPLRKRTADRAGTNPSTPIPNLARYLDTHNPIRRIEHGQSADLNLGALGPTDTYW